MPGKSRVLAAALTAALLFLLLSSALYIAMEAEHDCTGDDCPICCRLAVCENAMKLLGQAAGLVLFAAAAAVSASALPSAAKKAARAVSLVSLKVKLSD